MDCLLPGNYNEKMCSSCIFRTDGNQVQLSKERMEEILNYLTTFESSHICHQTNKTCMGGLIVTTKAMYEKGIIPENKVNTMLQIAQYFLVDKG